MAVTLRVFEVYAGLRGSSSLGGAGAAPASWYRTCTVARFLFGRRV
jgi:hypothetical protein